MKDSYNILLLGAGNLGSRHLQGLAKMELPSEVFVVDPSDKSLETSRNRFNEIPKNDNIRGISFCRTLEDTGLRKADFCIVASTADVRLGIIRDILPVVIGSNILLEKVIFQTVAEIEEASHLFSNNGCKVWVNCPRRVTQGYEKIRNALSNRSISNFSVSGGMWGLASSAIHFIDIFSFICGELQYSLDTSGLDKIIHISNRPSFIDLSGRLNGVFCGGANFTLEATKEIKAPITVRIEGDGFSVVVNETEGFFSISGPNAISSGKQEFSIPRQSEISHIIAREIIVGGRCGLTSYEASAKLHVPVLEAFLSHINSISSSKYTRCPIT